MAEAQFQMADNQQQQNSRSNEEAAAEARQQQEAMKNTMLSQVLDQHALARLNTLRVAKPERGAMVENILLNMMRTGQLRGKMTEEEFVSILNRVPTSQSTSVKFERRRESSDEEDFMKDL